MPGLKSCPLLAVRPQASNFELFMPRLTDVYNTDAMTVLTLIELGRSNEHHQTQGVQDKRLSA